MNKIQNHKILRKKDGQVFLETSFALIVTILLILGATYIFVWLNKSLVERQESYKATRTNETDGHSYTGGIEWKEDFYTPSPLRIFNHQGD